MHYFHFITNANQNDPMIQALCRIGARDDAEIGCGGNVVDFSMFKARRMLRDIEDEYFARF